MLSLILDTRDVNACSNGSCTSHFLFSSGAEDVLLPEETVGPTGTGALPDCKVVTGGSAG